MSSTVTFTLSQEDSTTLEISLELGVTDDSSTLQTQLTFNIQA